MAREGIHRRKTASRVPSDPVLEKETTEPLPPEVTTEDFREDQSSQPRRRPERVSDRTPFAAGGGGAAQNSSRLNSRPSIRPARRAGPEERASGISQRYRGRENTGTARCSRTSRGRSLSASRVTR